jgi:hypothetical protein
VDLNLNALVPDVARALGLSPSLLLILLMYVPRLARAVGRAIPDDATGFPGFARRLCAVVSADVPNRVTSGVTTDEVALAAATTAPIDAKVEAATGVDPKHAAPEERP